LNKNEITELQNNNNDMTTLAHTQNACKINNGMSFYRNKLRCKPTKGQSEQTVKPKPFQT